MAQIPCFVLNLASATQRREAMQQVLTQHGIQANWFDAVDGRVMSSEDIAKHCALDIAARVYGTMSRAEIGCALSHLGIYRRMVEQNIACAVILEDVVLLAKDFASLLDNNSGVASLFRADESVMLQLTHVERGYRFGARRLGARRIVRPHGGIWLTSGYFITLAAAKRMIEGAYPVQTSADHWRYFEQEGLLELHVLTPNAVWEAPLSQDSAIEVERLSRPPTKRSGWDYITRLWDVVIVRPLFVKNLPRFFG